MKAKRFLTLMAMLLLAVVTAFAQAKDEVTLTVSGDGATKEEATKVALRSAIEQAYGTFVSANTQILNDELVKDEIVTVSSGNVKSYKELACLETQGRSVVTLQATVCISKLVSYAQSKGASTEFAGKTLAMNLKIKELNKKNKATALRNLLVLMTKLFPSCYDLSHTMSEPALAAGNSDLVKIRFNILKTPNANAARVREMFLTTLEGINLPQEEREAYKTMNIQMQQVDLCAVHKVLLYNDEAEKTGVKYGLCFRSEAVKSFFKQLKSFTAREICNIAITDNLGEKWKLKEGFNNTNQKGGFLPNGVPSVLTGYCEGDMSVKASIDAHDFLRTPVSYEVDLYIPQAEIDKYSEFQIANGDPIELSETELNLLSE